MEEAWMSDEAHKKAANFFIDKEFPKGGTSRLHSFGINEEQRQQTITS